jgi:hypothetical protein
MHKLECNYHNIPLGGSGCICFKEPYYNLFGSKSSVDYDVMVYVKSIPAIQECKTLCAKLEHEFASRLSLKKRNVNLAIIGDGVIQRVFKGTPDECNNSVLATYALHRQSYPLPIVKKVSRNVPLKLARSLRIMLSFLSRTEQRAIVKSALRGSASDKLSVLSEIHFHDIKNLGKNNQDLVEFYKQSAFQIGQCLGLMNGAELYTKEDIVRYCFDLEGYLKRNNHNGAMLDEYKQHLIDLILNTYKDVNSTIHE